MFIVIKKEPFIIFINFTIIPKKQTPQRKMFIFKKMCQSC
ncbi:hypothetical protein Leryth_015106 [Lithospermum erythrorhizon]|nr:hypothetical protein Leryth_015106 [Lithospermum erythrorhizon]